MKRQGSDLMFSERFEIDHIVNAYGLTRQKAREIFAAHAGDRQSLYREAELLRAQEP